MLKVALFTASAQSFSVEKSHSLPDMSFRNAIEIDDGTEDTAWKLVGGKACDGTPFQTESKLKLPGCVTAATSSGATQFVFTAQECRLFGQGDCDSPIDQKGARLYELRESTSGKKGNGPGLNRPAKSGYTGGGKKAKGLDSGSSKTGTATVTSGGTATIISGGADSSAGGGAADSALDFSTWSDQEIADFCDPAGGSESGEIEVASDPIVPYDGTIDDYVFAIFGDYVGEGGGCTYSSPSVLGSQYQYTLYSGGPFFIKEGFIISTGSAKSLAGENTVGSKSNYYTGYNSAYAGYDPAALTVDLTCEVDTTVRIAYIFGSEEYPEFANTNFNDAMGVNVDGVNIAGLPDGTPFAINNVNHVVNPQYYIANGPTNFKPTQADGFTVALIADIFQPAGETKTWSAFIKDRHDGFYNSWAILAAASSIGCSEGFYYTPDLGCFSCAPGYVVDLLSPTGCTCEPFMPEKCCERGICAWDTVTRTYGPLDLNGVSTEECSAIYQSDPKNGCEGMLVWYSDQIFFEGGCQIKPPQQFPGQELPICMNGVQDDEESDIDCGAPDCLCGEERMCLSSSNCKVPMTCESGLCRGDDDKDGIPDYVDLCLDTVFFPVEDHGTNQWMATKDPSDEVGKFVTVHGGVVQDTNPGRPDGYSMIDTAGCSCQQILALVDGKSGGNVVRGCSNGLMDKFIADQAVPSQ